MTYSSPQRRRLAGAKYAQSLENLFNKYKEMHIKAGVDPEEAEKRARVDVEAVANPEGSEKVYCQYCEAETAQFEKPNKVFKVFKCLACKGENDPLDSNWAQARLEFLGFKTRRTSW